MSTEDDAPEIPEAPASKETTLESPPPREPEAPPPAAQESASVSEPQFLHADASAAADTGSVAIDAGAGAGTGAASVSQRVRFIPPDGRATSLLKKHREKILLAELALTALFFLLALFFLYRWLTHEPPVAYAPDREGFRAALAALPPAEAENVWRVDAVPGRWRGIVVHHTAGSRGSVASIDRYHREENKWPNGLGYHFLIGNGDGMKDGEVGIGPRWEKQLDGAHVRMSGTDRGNSFSIGVALVGNFEERVPSAKQLASLRGVLRFLTEEYGISPAAIAGHGQVSEKFTACPGRLFFIDDVVTSL